MPNSVAGDFNAVLQVSGRVLDRLMASIHQNAARGFESLPHSLLGDAISNAIGNFPQDIGPQELPSFPHSVFLRIGDPLPVGSPLLTLVIGQPTDLQDASQYDSVSSLAGAAVAVGASGVLQQASPSGSATAAATSMASALDGVRGTVRAQAGAPRIELINAARRFIIEVPIRARYTPDVGTTALPEFIHGVVRAEYSVREISLAGGAKRLLRFAVVPANVSFQSYGPHTSDDARIARQIARVLQTRFLPTDQQIGFPLHTIKSVVAGGFSAVTVALPIGGNEPQGSLTTFASMLLQGNDFAVGVSAVYMESLANAAAAALVGRGRRIKQWGFTYTITVQSAYATYTVEGNAGIITITATILADGEAAWGPAPDFVFDITQRSKLEFDATTGTLTLVKDGGPKLPLWLKLPAAVVGGLSFLDSEVDKAIAGAKSELAKIAAQTSMLDEVLKKLDTAPKSQLTAAHFQPDGMVLLGRIWLAPRFGPVLEFNKLSTLDGYSACPSWLPGGRIDSFHWRWSWFYPTQSAMVNPLAQGGSTLTHTDRFIMRSTTGVPGLHGSPGNLMTGAVCLNIRGVQMDPQSGDPIQVDTSVLVMPRPVCQFFSPHLHLDVPRGQGKLLSRLRQKNLRDPRSVWPEVALLDLGGGVMSEGQNTLVCYFPEAPRPEDFRAIRQAIAECGRTDTGLLVAVVLGEGAALSERSESDRRSELHDAVAAIPTYVLVTDDVQHGWAAAFQMRGDRRGLGLRLVVPGGRIAWSSDGPVEARELAAALREHLVAAPLPELESLGAGIEPGAEPPATLVELAPNEAVSLRALRGSSIVLCFVRADSRSSEAQLTALDRQADVFARRATQVIAIVDQADARAAHAVKHKLALSYHVAADPDSSITHRWGVRLWPTTVVISERGLVERVQLGTDSLAFGARETEASAY